MRLNDIVCRCFVDIVFMRVIILFYLSSFRFQGQTQLYKSKPSDFRMALEEAMLAENGILESQLGAEDVTDVKAHPYELMEATGSCADQEYYCQDQVRFFFFILCFIPSW